MSKGETAADAILRIVKQNEQLMAAAEVLKEYGSFENAVIESKKRLDAMQVEESSVRKALDEFMSSSEQYKADALLEITNAKAEAKRLTDKAKEKAASITEAAENESKAKIEAAENHLANILADNESRVKALKSLIDERTTLVAELDRTIEIKTAEINALDNKLDKLTAQINKLVSATSDRVNDADANMAS